MSLATRWSLKTGKRHDAQAWRPHSRPAARNQVGASVPNWSDVPILPTPIVHELNVPNVRPRVTGSLGGYPRPGRGRNKLPPSRCPLCEVVADQFRVVVDN